MDLALNNLQRLNCHKNQTTNHPTFSKAPALLESHHQMVEGSYPSADIKTVYSTFNLVGVFV